MKLSRLSLLQWKILLLYMQVMTAVLCQLLFTNSMRFRMDIYQTAISYLSNSKMIFTRITPPTQIRRLCWGSSHPIWHVNSGATKLKWLCQRHFFQHSTRSINTALGLLPVSPCFIAKVSSPSAARMESSHLFGEGERQIETARLITCVRVKVLPWKDLDTKTSRTFFLVSLASPNDRLGWALKLRYLHNCTTFSSYRTGHILLCASPGTFHAHYSTSSPSFIIHTGHFWVCLLCTPGECHRRYKRTRLTRENGLQSCHSHSKGFRMV